MMRNCWKAQTMALGLSGLLVLSACATPQERCVRDINRDLNTVTRLISETELNLARGFRYETEVRRSSVGFSGCVGRGWYSYSGVRLCSSSDVRTVQVAVPIDPVAEQRKLEGLKTRQSELSRISSRAQTACAARYPN